MPRGFPLQDEGPGMSELFHDLQVEQEQERAAKPKPPYPFCRTAEYCAGKGYCPHEFACND